VTAGFPGILFERSCSIPQKGSNGRNTRFCNHTFIEKVYAGADFFSCEIGESTVGDGPQNMHDPDQCGICLGKKRCKKWDSHFLPHENNSMWE